MAAVPTADSALPPRIVVLPLRANAVCMDVHNTLTPIVRLPVNHVHRCTSWDVFD